MIKYPTCDMANCEDDAQIYFGQDKIYVCQNCLMNIHEGGEKVDLPHLSVAINAIEYSKYTLAQMKDFIIDFRQQGNFKKISPMVIEYEKELCQYLEDLELIKRKNKWFKMVDMTKTLQKFMKTIQDSEAMRQISITKSVIEFKEAAEGINQQEEVKLNKKVAQTLKDRANFIIELQSQIETLTEELANKEELIQRLVLLSKYLSRIAIISLDLKKEA